MNSYAKNIKPFVAKELKQADDANKQGDHRSEFQYLENAHVLGQASTYYHVKVHCLMLLWSVKNKNPKEFAGQLFRIIGAATKTFVGLIPQGNTGGANVSPFKVMPIKPEFQTIIQSASVVKKNNKKQ